MDVIQSGVPGLDDILGGGVPKNQLILITGTSGTGKTTICNQFIHNGITENGENGVYLSFEEPAETITEHARQFGWDLNKLEKSGKFSFIKYNPYRIHDVFDILETTIKEIGAKRVAIDSISALGLHVRDSAELRTMIFQLSLILRKLKCTSFIVSEIVHGTEPRLSRYGVEEFVADGVVVLYYERIDSVFNRAVQVWKMRGQKHSNKLHPYLINDKGVIINSRDSAVLRER